MTAKPAGSTDFDAWLRTACFQKPSLEAYDLAKCAWGRGLTLPAGLAPATGGLVLRFAQAMAEKLHAAEQKYGYTEGWRDDDWMDECRQKLREHIEKGDPRDVANYCAFLWHHGESTTPPVAAPTQSATHQLPDGRMFRRFDSTDAVLAQPATEEREQLVKLLEDGSATEYDRWRAAALLREQSKDARYMELIMAVGRKYPDESRHQTALRYIQQAEAPKPEEGAIDRAIERKHFKDIRELTQVVTRDMTIGGHSVPVANLPYTLTSDAGHLLAKDKPFAGCYWDTPEGRVFSLRSTETGMDVSEIAKQYGGGGHKHASGFRVPYGHELAR